MAYSTNYLLVEACVEIARDTIEGKMTLDDMDAVKARLEAAAGVSMGISKLDEEKGNFYLITSGSVIFGKDEF